MKRTRIFSASLPALALLFALTVAPGCGTFQDVEKAACPYVLEITKAAELLCSLQADSTAGSVQLSQARQQLGAAYNNLQAGAAVTVQQRQQLEKTRGQVQPAPGK